MKREIKFRGISKIYGCWRFGDLYRTNLEGCVAIQFYDEVDGWMTEDVTPGTVGQFTGVTGGDGREIYEDDIVAIYHEKHCTFKGKVEFLCGEFVVNSKDKLITALSRKPWQVIGNIHDNPELMEAAAK